MAQFGSALGLGPRGREFESLCSNQFYGGMDGVRAAHMMDMTIGTRRDALECDISDVMCFSRKETRKRSSENVFND